MTGRKSVRGQPPFENYWVYGPYRNSEGRSYVHLTKIDGPVRFGRLSFQYARYLMCVHLGKEIEDGLVVDHKDNNPSNDSLENLQIITFQENVAKDHAKANILDLICPECGVHFKRRHGACHSALGTAQRSFCSRSCAARFYRKRVNAPVG